jgi:hypothetical protein
VQQGSAKLQSEAGKISSAMKTWTRTSQDANSAASRQSRALYNLAISYENMGAKGSAAMRETLQQAGRLKDQMDTMRMAVEAATPEGKFKMMATGFSQLTSGIAGAQGAMNLLGIKSEGAAEAMMKLQSLMALSQGLQQLVMLEDTVSALAKNINLATAAQKALNFAMSFSGGAIIALVSGLVVAIGSMVIANNEAAAAAKRAADALKYEEEMVKAVKSAINETNEIFDDAAEMDALRAKAAGKSEKDLYQIKYKGLIERAELFRKESNNQKRSIGEQAAYRDAAFKLDQEAEKAKLNEQIRVNAESAAIQAAANAKAKALADKKVATMRKAYDDMMAQSERDKEVAQKMLDAYEAPGRAGSSVLQRSVKLDIKFDTKAMAGRIGTLMNDINSALTSGIQSLAADFAGSLGDLAAAVVQGADEPLKEFGKSMLQTLSGFMATLGKAIMAAGLASQTFQTQLLTNPVAAVAAGAALIVAAGAVRGLMQKGVDNKTPMDAQPEGIRRFASGGIVSGPTIGLMGEYPGAASNPEVVAPLDKLKAMMGGGGGGQLVARIDGQDLLVMLDRAERNRGRVR